MATSKSSRKRRMSRKRRRRIRRRITCIALVVIVIIAIICVVKLVRPLIQKAAHNRASKNTSSSQSDLVPAFDPSLSGFIFTEKRTIYGSASDLMTRRTDILCAQYNYDEAIEVLSKAPMEVVGKMDRLNRYQAEKDSCVEWDVTDAYHIFFHTLVYDAELAFDGDDKEAGYNQVMTTVDEFNKMMDIMYERGYILISVHDLAKMEVDASGNEVMTKQTIMLPEGKKPMVLSQDDVSYYHYMDGDGMATKLIVDQNGVVRNEYIERDGSTSVGSYDMVPLIDDFVNEHPDFAYHGHKGIIALTGYNGVLGYRTDTAYLTHENLDDIQVKFFEEHPDYDEDWYYNEIETAKRVAECMRNTGWEFASHTWGHQNVGTASLEKVQEDANKWADRVETVIGDTDVIIFAFGSDLGDWHPYDASTNEKYAFMKSMGFDYYCNVDGSNQFMQVTDDSFRQGRWNLDGYRMYYYPEKLADMFDVSDVWDNHRPTPVPPM